MAIDWSKFAVGGATRPDSFTGLTPEFASALANMFMAAPPDVQAQLRVSSGFRSPERQAQLWEQALAKYGSPEAARKWVAPPGRSQHNHGNAVDLKYLGDAARAWAHENAGQFGLAFPLSNEDWHIELASARGGKPAPVANHSHQAPTAPAAPAAPAPRFGDFVAPQPAPVAPDLGMVMAAALQNRQRAEEARAEQEAAEMARRRALLGDLFA